VHVLLEEFKISLKSSLSTQSLCHIISPGVGVEIPQKTRAPHFNNYLYKHSAN